MNNDCYISPYEEVVLLAFYVNKLRNEHTLANPEHAYGIARKNTEKDPSIFYTLREEYLEQVKSSSNTLYSAHEEQQLQSNIESALVNTEDKVEQRALNNQFILDAMNTEHDDEDADEFYDDDDNDDESVDTQRVLHSIARAQRANNKYADSDDHHDDTHCDDDHHE